MWHLPNRVWYNELLYRRKIRRIEENMPCSNDKKDGIANKSTENRVEVFGLAGKLGEVCLEPGCTSAWTRFSRWRNKVLALAEPKQNSLYCLMMESVNRTMQQHRTLDKSTAYFHTFSFRCWCKNCSENATPNYAKKSRCLFFTQWVNWVMTLRKIPLEVLCPLTLPMHRLEHGWNMNMRFDSVGPVRLWSGSQVYPPSAPTLHPKKNSSRKRGTNRA